MKKIFSLIILIGGILLISGCKRNETSNLPNIISTPLPLLTIDETTDFLIADPATFKSTFNVGFYFKNNTQPRTSDVVVTMNGDYSNVKVLKAGVTSLPTSISITTNDLSSLFGKTPAQIVEGDYFEIGINMTLPNGTVIPAFLVGASPYGPDALNFAGSSPTIKYRKVCPLDLNAFTGSFIVDDPDFWGASYPVTIALDGTTGLKITGWIESPNATIHLVVDEKKQTITIPSQVYLASYAGFTNFNVVGSGEIDACNVKMTLNTTNTVTEGSFGAATIVVHK